MKRAQPRLTPTRHLPRIGVTLLLFGLIHAIGTIGYLSLGPPGTTAIDGLYMTFITVASIGYSEIVDLNGNAPGRMFTIAIALAGIGTMTYLFSSVTALILEASLDRTLWRRRMLRRIEQLSMHYLVCGAGRIGSYVIEEMRASGLRFIVIETSRETLERHLERDPDLLVIEGDAADDDMLERAGIGRAAGVFAVTGDDARNLVISLSAKQLNPSVRVIARVHDQRNAAKTLRAGADEIVSPDFTGGHRIASLMIRPQMVSLMDELVRSGHGLAVEEVIVPAQTMMADVAALGRSPDWLLVAIRNGERWQFNPAGDAPLEPGAALVVIAGPDGQRALKARLST